SGAVSAVGTGARGPYTWSLDASTERRDAASTRQASATLASNVPTGSSRAAGTVVCAARWNVTSASAGGSAPRATATTSSPRSRSARTSRRPSSPLAPVTAALTDGRGSCSRPQLPRCVALLPEVVEQRGVLVGVHA